MKLFSLGGRLALCASMVRPGTSLADVGTDHAYLPIWLARTGRIRCAVASDIRPGPLERAKENIERWGAGDTVATRLCDGLDGIISVEADDIVVAGMGGLIMADIIRRTPWLRDPSKRLILQPMTRPEELRRCLAELGFAIRAEEAAMEEGHSYAAILCAFDPAESGGGMLYPYIGKLKADTPASCACLKKELRSLAARESGLRHSGNTWKADELSIARQGIESLLSVSGGPV